MAVRLVDCDRTRASEILAILNEAIENTTAIYDYEPRTLAMIEEWFAAKERRGDPVIAAIDETGRLLGFATYGRFRERPAYKYSVEHSVYVDRAFRGRGVGRQLLAAIIERARAQQLHMLVAGIDADNAISIELHRRFGFVFCGEIRDAGFKFGRWLHLQFYELILDTPARPVDGCGWALTIPTSPASTLPRSDGAARSPRRVPADRFARTSAACPACRRCRGCAS